MADPNFDSLKKRLDEQLSFPTVYMFKFIVVADNQKMALIESFFSPEADIFHKSSNNGKYISITAKEVMMSSEDIIDIYKRASVIEGVVAL
jgi:uncharacterized protein